MASGINNAVARVAGLLAVAVLPLIAGLTGDKFYDPAAMTDGFHMAMVACAGLAALGGILAWLTISSDVLGPSPNRFRSSRARSRGRRCDMGPRATALPSPWSRLARPTAPGA